MDDTDNVMAAHDTKIIYEYVQKIWGNQNYGHSSKKDFIMFDFSDSDYDSDDSHDSHESSDSDHYLEYYEEEKIIHEDDDPILQLNQ